MKKNINKEVVKVRKKGELTLPKRLREYANINEDEFLKVTVDGTKIILEKLDL